VRLISGEDLICGVERALNGGDYILDRPAQIIMVPDQNGRINIRMIPFLPFSDTGGLKIPASVVAFEYAPSIDLMNEYNSRYGSGIVVPQVDPKKLLLES